MAEWIAEGEPSLDLWQMDIRRFGAPVPLARPTRSRARARSTRPTTTSATRTTSARRGGRCASRRPTPGTASTAPPSARSPAGSGSTGTSRTRRRGDEALRPRGWAGQHWSPAIGAEHRATREAAGAVRRVLVRQDRGRRARARPRSSSGSATTGSRASVGADHLHADAQPARRDRVRLHRHPPGRGPLLDRHRHRVRQPRPRAGCAASAPADGTRPDRATSPRAGPASGSGARGRATSWRR